jgi:hypothetical protein
MSSNLGEIAKKLILVFGKKPPEGYPSHPPPPPNGPGFGDSHTWRNAKLSHQNAKSGRQNETPEWGKGGGGIPPLFK